MHGTEFLVQLLLVLAFAKFAAEGAERIAMPAVVGEILAGVVVGPSVLGWVKDTSLLLTLGEIGVILLLLQVGLEMDLGELGAVGKAALGVAVVGVVLPFASGAGAGIALGMSSNEALFVGAALTATSVGITARVFGDLRALASVEARTVLGAAVADDVFGLVILTVVVRLVEVGSVSITDVAKVVAIAVAFLAVSTLAGLRIVPPVFAAVGRRSRSGGTLIGLALAFTFGLAHLAELADLAPIIGAFVAGICLARSPVRQRLEGDLGPLANLFVPIFFFRIGVDADVTQFGSPKVLGLAGVLVVVAVVGKVAASMAMGRAPGDRLLVGLGMLPRGEVGLIFATIGLQQKVFGEDVYAALLLVVLVTTLAAPPLLKMRLLQLRKRAAAEPAEVGEKPPGGWLAVGDTVELVARPPVREAAQVGLEAAIAVAEARPGETLIRWADGLPGRLELADPRTQAAFGRLLADGGPRSWRFLVVSGLLRRLLPELDDAVARRAGDLFDPDPLGSLRWPRVARLHDTGHVPSLVVGLAALVLDATDGDSGPAGREAARSVAAQLGLGPSTIDAVVDLVGDADLLVAMAHRPGFDDVHLRQLVTHIASIDRLHHLAELTTAAHQLDHGEAAAVAELVERTGGFLGDLTRTAGAGLGAGATVVADAAEETDGPVRERIRATPPAQVLRIGASELIRRAQLAEPPPEPGAFRTDVAARSDGTWSVLIVARDRVGLLANQARAMASLGLDVLGADLATWPDGVALADFGVAASSAPDVEQLRTALDDAQASVIETEPVADVAIDFDQAASPWFTVCRVDAANQSGLLAALAAAFAKAEITVDAARIATRGERAADEFDLAGPGGDKLTALEMDEIERAVADGVRTRRRIWGGSRLVAGR